MVEVIDIQAAGDVAISARIIIAIAITPFRSSSTVAIPITMATMMITATMMTMSVTIAPGIVPASVQATDDAKGVWNARLGTRRTYRRC